MMSNIAHFVPNFSQLVPNIAQLVPNISQLVPNITQLMFNITHFVIITLHIIQTIQPLFIRKDESVSIYVRKHSKDVCPDICVQFSPMICRDKRSIPLYVIVR